MIKSVSLWHFTPADLGQEFLNQTETLLETDGQLYTLACSNTPLNKRQYSKTDYASVMKMRKFIAEVNLRIAGTESVLLNDYPNVQGCFAHYKVRNNLYCYIMVSGMAVFYEIGNPIQYDNENYYCIELFRERLKYENDYCENPNKTELKKDVYEFIDILWDSLDTKVNFGNHGIRYTLCVNIINNPDFISGDMDFQDRRNANALLETAALNNVLTTNNKDAIHKLIDNNGDHKIHSIELSENLIFADNWSGVLLMGDIENNEVYLNWFIEYEVWLQSNWLLFDSYCDKTVKQKLSSIQLQGILNRAEYIKVQLENDISSNMEQCKFQMRHSLIETSCINSIYNRMHGIITNKMKMVGMMEEQTKDRYAYFSDLSLCLIALLQIYGIINELIAKKEFTESDKTTMMIMLVITLICSWFIFKSKKKKL